MVSPYTRERTEQLMAALERTRAEVKAAIGVLMDTSVDAATVRNLAASLHRTVGEITTDLRNERALATCPCCQGVMGTSLVLCAECVEAGDADQEFATPDQPYPYCAATDSSPLAEPNADDYATERCEARTARLYDETQMSVAWSPWLGDVDRRHDDDVEFCVEGE